MALDDRAERVRFARELIATAEPFSEPYEAAAEYLASLGEECGHAPAARRIAIRRGTFDYTYELCGECGAYRLLDEDGEPYGWHLPRSAPV